MAVSLAPGAAQCPDLRSGDLPGGGHHLRAPPAAGGRHAGEIHDHGPRCGTGAGPAVHPSDWLGQRPMQQQLRAAAALPVDAVPGGPAGAAHHPPRRPAGGAAGLGGPRPAGGHPDLRRGSAGLLRPGVLHAARGPAVGPVPRPGGPGLLHVLLHGERGRLCGLPPAGAGLERRAAVRLPGGPGGVPLHHPHPHLRLQRGGHHEGVPGAGGLCRRRCPGRGGRGGGGGGGGAAGGGAWRRPPGGGPLWPPAVLRRPAEVQAAVGAVGPPAVRAEDLLLGDARHLRRLPPRPGRDAAAVRGTAVQLGGGGVLHAVLHRLRGGGAVPGRAQRPPRLRAPPEIRRRHPYGQPGAVPSVRHLHLLLAGDEPAGAPPGIPLGLPQQHGQLHAVRRRHLPVPQRAAGHADGGAHRLRLRHAADAALHPHLPLPQGGGGVHGQAENENAGCGTQRPRLPGRPGRPRPLRRSSRPDRVRGSQRSGWHGPGGGGGGGGGLREARCGFGLRHPGRDLPAVPGVPHAAHGLRGAAGALGHRLHGVLRGLRRAGRLHGQSDRLRAEGPQGLRPDGARRADPWSKGFIKCVRVCVRL